MRPLLYHAYTDSHDVFCVERLSAKVLNFEQVPLLAEAYPDHIYFTLDQFTEGFQKPSRPITAKDSLRQIRALFDNEDEDEDFDLLSQIESVLVRYEFRNVGS